TNGGPRCSRSCLAKRSTEVMTIRSSKKRGYNRTPVWASVFFLVSCPNTRRLCPSPATPHRGGLCFVALCKCDVQCRLRGHEVQVCRASHSQRSCFSGTPPSRGNWVRAD